MPTQQSNFLEINAISVGYSARPAKKMFTRFTKNKFENVVNSASFSLAEGELGCLLGPSGCGKTTILKAISGFHKLSSGEILLDGKSLATVSHSIKPEKRQVGMVFQDLALFPHLTIAQNISFGLTGLSSAQKRSKVEAMLSLIGLQGRATSYPHELSGGQSQRVALARAIAPSPKLLLMDEPFSNLDAELRESLGLEIRTLLKETGITAIMVTHDQSDAFALGDKVGVISEGTLLQWASPFDLYHAPSSRFVAQFIGDGVFIKGEMVSNNVVVTEFGEVHGDIVNNTLLGKKIDLLIRPDDVKHNPSSHIQGNVIRKTFKGAQTLYSIKTGGGEELMSLMPSHNDFEIGDSFGVSIDADHLVCFPAIEG